MDFFSLSLYTIGHAETFWQHLVSRTYNLFSIFNLCFFLKGQSRAATWGTEITGRRPVLEVACQYTEIQWLCGLLLRTSSYFRSVSSAIYLASLSCPSKASILSSSAKLRLSKTFRALSETNKQKAEKTWLVPQPQQSLIHANLHNLKLKQKN